MSKSFTKTKMVDRRRLSARKEDVKDKEWKGRNEKKERQLEIIFLTP